MNTPASGTADSAPPSLLSTAAALLGWIAPATSTSMSTASLTKTVLYLWGTAHPPVTEPAYRAFSSPDSNLNEVALAGDFAAQLADQLGDAAAGSSPGHWFHYGSSEARHLHRLLGHDAKHLLASATDLLNGIIRPNLYAPAGYGSKSSAPTPAPHGGPRAPGERTLQLGGSCAHAGEKAA